MTALESFKKIIPPLSKPIQNRSLNDPGLSTVIDEPYKNVYSHGLESIYAIETIDLKSVRKIDSSPKVKSEKPKPAEINIPDQDDFDFGVNFRNWIVPFIKKEPIQVLNLSKHTEKCLIENGKPLLEHLLNSDLKDFVQIRGMGQGHIEEIRQQLNSYVDGANLDRSYSINFISLLKKIVSSQERKKTFVLLEKYDLQHIISLTPAENVEVRKLTLEKRQECLEEIVALITNDESLKTIKEDLKSIFNAFIIPWIDKRGGFATKAEIEMRLQMLSENGKCSLNVLNLIQEIFFQNKMLDSLLIKVEKDIFCSFKHHSELYQNIIETTKSYFYSMNVHYELDHLSCLIEREFAKNWIGFVDGYVSKILKQSPLFATARNKRDCLEIFRVSS